MKLLLKLAFALFLFSQVTGCICFDFHNPMPSNAEAQIQNTVDCRKPVLAMVVYFGIGMQLGTPVITQYPFDNLRDIVGGHSVGVAVTPSWGVGSGKHASAMLLICSDGTVYEYGLMYHQEFDDYYLEFYRAEISPAWLAELEAASVKDKWEVMKADYERSIWTMPSCACQRGMSGKVLFSWDDPEKAHAVLKSFIKDYSPFPIKDTSCWKRYFKLIAEANVYCRKHTAPQFSADQVLRVNDEKPPDSDHYFTINGEAVKYIISLERTLKRELRSGKYKVLLYDRAVFDGDPERDGEVMLMRKIAEENNVAFAIAVRDGKTKGKSAYSGFPDDSTIYWQCAACTAEVK